LALLGRGSGPVPAVGGREPDVGLGGGGGGGGGGVDQKRQGQTGGGLHHAALQVRVGRLYCPPKGGSNDIILIARPACRSSRWTPGCVRSRTSRDGDVGPSSSSRRLARADARGPHRGGDGDGDARRRHLGAHQRSDIVPALSGAAVRG